MKYKIVFGNTFKELENNVNYEIRNCGFKPLGGVCGYENVSGRLLQAMINDEKTKVNNKFDILFGDKE